MNPGSAPERIGQTHSTHKGSDLRMKPGPSRAAASALPAPVVSEPLSVPTDDRFGVDDHQRSFPVAPSALKERPESSIEVSQSRPSRCGPEHRELLPQSQVLEDELASGPEDGSGGSEQDPKKANHHAERISATGAKTAVHRTDEKTTGTGSLQAAYRVHGGSPKANMIRQQHDLWYKHSEQVKSGEGYIYPNSGRCRRDRIRVSRSRS